MPVQNSLASTDDLDKNWAETPFNVTKNLKANEFGRITLYVELLASQVENSIRGEPDQPFTPVSTVTHPFRKWGLYESSAATPNHFVKLFAWEPKYSGTAGALVDFKILL